MPRKSSQALDDIRAVLVTINATVQTLGHQLARSATDTNAAARNDDMTEHLHAELGHLRREVAELRASILAARTSRSPSSSSSPSSDENNAYLELLRRAAGIAYAELTCHRDTWAFIVERAGNNEHFALSVDIDEDDDGTIEVGISGRTLIAAIDALWNTRITETNPGTRSLATTIYQRISHALDQDGNGNGPDHRNGDSIHVVVDDRTPSRSKPTAADEEHPDTPGAGSARS